MKEFTYNPKLEVDGKKVFDGDVTIAIPKYKERLAMLKDINFKFNGTEIDAGLGQIDSMIKMVEIAELHIKRFNLTRNGEYITSVDDLQYDKEGSDLLNEIGNVILSGIPMGKS